MHQRSRLLDPYLKQFSGKTLVFAYSVIFIIMKVHEIEAQILTHRIAHLLCRLLYQLDQPWFKTLYPVCLNRSLLW